MGLTGVWSETESSRMANSNKDVTVGEIHIQRVLKYIYESSNLHFMRITFLYLPSCISLVSLHILSLGICCINEFLICHDILLSHALFLPFFGNLDIVFSRAYIYMFVSPSL